MWGPSIVLLPLCVADWLQHDTQLSYSAINVVSQNTSTVFYAHKRDEKTNRVERQKNMVTHPLATGTKKDYAAEAQQQLTRT
jgi:hypothetical protein